MMDTQEELTGKVPVFVTIRDNEVRVDMDAIRADERKRIREALLSDEVIDTIHSQLLYLGTGMDAISKSVEYAIGLTEEQQ